MGLFNKSDTYESLFKTVFRFSTDCSLSMINVLFSHGIRSNSINADNSDLFFLIYVQSKILQNYTFLYGQRKADKFVDFYIKKLREILFNNLDYQQYDSLENHMDKMELDIFKAVYYNHIVEENDNPALRLCKTYLKYVVSPPVESPDLISAIIKELESQHIQTNNICYKNKI